MFILALVASAIALLAGAGVPDRESLRRLALALISLVLCSGLTTAVVPQPNRSRSDRILPDARFPVDGISAVRAMVAKGQRNSTRQGCNGVRRPGGVSLRRTVELGELPPQP